MFNPKSELLKTFWEKGSSPDCPIIDFHAHMNPHVGSFQPGASAEKMAAKMARCNTRLMLFSSHDSLFMPSLKHACDIEAVEKYPDRMRAYFVISSNSTDLDAELALLKSRPDIFVGLKNLTGYSGRGIIDPIYTPFYEYANEHHMPILCHTWGGGLIKEAEQLVTEYPDLTLLVGHSFHGAWEEAARLANAYDNLYLELTAVIDEVGPLELLLRKCGSEKIVFGTDLPWFDTIHGVGYIFSTPMTDRDRENILFRNGCRILEKHEWFQQLWSR